MRIILTSARKTGPSFIFYSKSLNKINNNFVNVSVEISTNPTSVNYNNFDVALFIGYDECSRLAKKQNKEIITGVLDPRASQKIEFEFIDFLGVNDLESRDYFLKFCKNIIIYRPYPIVPQKLKCPVKKDKLILGYHGNKIHLEAMYPRITDAIESLNREIPLELWAMYNINDLGKWRRKLDFPVRHIQYSEENYAKYIAHTDIGIVPQLIPVTKNKILRYLIGTMRCKYNESMHDFILRFKETTNIGRHLVFAQYGIPVVSDMTPSACSFIQDNVDGFVAFHTASWHQALKKLALNPESRKLMGKNLKAKYENFASHQVQNKRLVNFLREIVNKQKLRKNFYHVV